MIAHVQTIRLAPGGLTQAIENLRDDQLTALRQAVGCVGLIALTSLSDSTAGARIEVVSLWDDRQMFATYAADRGQHEQTASVMLHQATPSEEHVYEVAQVAGMQGGSVARFISARLHPGNIDTVMSLFENVVMHAATEQRGFRRGLLLVDRTTDRVISIGLWNSEADLHASERIGYLSQQIGNFTQLVTAPIAPETLVVAFEA